MQQQLAHKDKELDQMRREVSTLRSEKAEDQRTINELHSKLESIREQHTKDTEKLRESHLQELESVKKEHAREIEERSRQSDRAGEILAAMKLTEGYATLVSTCMARIFRSLDALNPRFESITYTLSSLREQMASIGSREEDVDKVLKAAEEKFAQLSNQLEQERREIASQKEETARRMEAELESVTKRYTDEVTEGRRWVEEERKRLEAHRQAFQEEQAAILDSIEQKKEELDRLKTSFLSSEHDLLLRVVNERALLEQQRRSFERQRNSDVARLRHEAENLERYLLHVNQARRALESSQKGYERKLAELQELKQLLVQYEKEMAFTTGVDK